MQIPQLITGRRPFVSLEFFPPKNRDEWPAFVDAARELSQLRPLHRGSWPKRACHHSSGSYRSYSSSLSCGESGKRYSPV